MCRSTVDEELHSWFNDRAREVEASLYGRRMYELMAAAWPKVPDDPSATPAMLDFARIWAETPRIVFSTTLERVEWNSRLVRGDIGDELARLQTEFDGDLDVGGPTLAASFIRRGLVDEYRAGRPPGRPRAGTPFFPELEAPIRLRLTETRTFGSGVVYLGYAAE
jgi:dihydrofolate reductase